ncbi:MAG: RimK family alpha-L-glutamate ligase [Clostridia bacterium]|nr:RimK family alpha-L-glutamate ligase [Clostridia bacterium]
MQTKKHGWIIINNLHTTSPKFVDTVNAFNRACEQNGVLLEVKTNFDFVNVLDGNFIRPDFVLFWDKDIRLAKELEALGIRVFNNATAIDECNDKYVTYLKLLNSDIPMPKTIIAPMVYYPQEWQNTNFIIDVEKSLKYPIVAKECFGSFGKQVFLCNNRQELIEVINNFAKRPFLLQEFIQTSVGKDLRLQVVGNKVVATMMRYNENDFRANVTNGGKMLNYQPNTAQIDMALKACKLLSLDFGGVDILFGKDDTPVLCEINSNAHFINLSNCTGVDVADCIVKYVLEEISK